MTTNDETRLAAQEAQAQLEAAQAELATLAAAAQAAAERERAEYRPTADLTRWGMAELLRFAWPPGAERIRKADRLAARAEIARRRVRAAVQAVKDEAARARHYELSARRAAEREQEQEV